MYTLVGFWILEVALLRTLPTRYALFSSLFHFLRIRTLLRFRFFKATCLCHSIFMVRAFASHHNGKR